MGEVRTIEAPVRLGRPHAIAALLGPRYDGLATERLEVLYLDRHFGLVCRSAIGGTHAVELPVGEIARTALAAGACGVVIAHNHPGGDATASTADRVATRRLAEALRAVSILLVDHLVFGRGEWTSFHDRGWL